MKTPTKDDLVILQIFDSEFTANMAKVKLEEQGLQCFIEDENVMGLNPLGGVELKIALRDLQKAQEILAV